eukprot:TRINITY_DN424_c0_g1_i1.p1 TRINITY_DN424_c0_g1~~TRINITY_DN424_c0_g1_i1.p1  ORF type:complete len:936 (-),score=185.18 TRINITY_DN424_c0_g1_i1:164-2971(-)
MSTALRLSASHSVRRSSAVPFYQTSPPSATAAQTLSHASADPQRSLSQRSLSQRSAVGSSASHLSVAPVSVAEDWIHLPSVKAVAGVDLAGTWNLQPESVAEISNIPSRAYPIQAAVPGSVHVALLDADLIEEPFLNFQEEPLRWILETKWFYSRSFDVPEDVLSQPRIELVCEEVDTIAEVFINEVSIGTFENMFRRYRHTIPTGLLKARDNTIRFAFSSPTEYCQQQAALMPYAIPHMSYPGQDPHWNLIRKPGCHFGWDWGPFFPEIGLHQSPKIIAYSTGFMTYVNHQQTHQASSVSIDVSVFVDALAARPAEIVASISSPDGRVVDTRTAAITLEAGEKSYSVNLAVSNPQLWWPLGFGEHPLYTLSVSLKVDGIEVDASSQKIGLRKVELVRDKESDGETFYVRVNGVAVFSKGANWIPWDCFIARITEDDMRYYMQSVVEANINILRVWGGARYESHFFYELCDANGVMLWQDFMFACALYPATDAFLENVRKEAVHQVRRLNHHPSVVLWCGSNENEQSVVDGWYPEVIANRNRYVVDFSKLYIDTIGKVVEEDPGRPFWPSSPSNGIQEWGNPNELTRGDVHYWEVWHGGKPFSEYQKIITRFCSEFGFQSFPSMETLRLVMSDADDFNVTSPAMEYRQRSPAIGNKGIIEQAMREFRFPSNFDKFVYIGQAIQSLSIKLGVEHWRRIKPYCMGTVYWQLNDIWPGASWSSMEYKGRWKMLHYYVKNFYATDLVSSREENNKVQVWFTTDRITSARWNVSLTLWNWDGTKAWNHEIVNLTIAAGSSGKIWEADIDQLLQGESRANYVLSFTATEAAASKTKAASTVINWHTFAPIKGATLPKPTLRMANFTAISSNKVSFELSTDAMAHYVFLSTAYAGFFSDNGFLLTPDSQQRPRQLTFTSRVPLTPADLQATTSAMSLYDSYH